MGCAEPGVIPNCDCGVCDPNRLIKPQPPTVRAIIDSPSLLEIGRKAVEDVLVDFRNSRIGLVGRGNGLVVAETNGKPSHIIRLTTESAIQIALEAILKSQTKEDNKE